MRAVSFEDAGRRKLAELVADHVFSDVNRDKGFAVVDVERVTDKIGRNGRPTRPRLNWLVSARLDGLLDFFEKVEVNEEAFFDGTCHGKTRGSRLLPAARLATVVVNNNDAVGQLGTTASREALCELTPRGNELLTAATTLRFTLTTTVRVIDWVHRHTANVGTFSEPTITAGFAE